MIRPGPVSPHNNPQRAVGFVNYDARGTRDNKRPCIIFLTKNEQFGRLGASLVLHCIAPTAAQRQQQQQPSAITLCTVPLTVTQHWIQQVHMSTTGEYVSFTVSDAQNPESTPKMPMLFHRNGSDLRACDHFIDHGQDLNGDALLSYYFPQFVNVGDIGVTWVLATCRASQTGARNVHLVKLQHPDKASFFSNFSLFKGRNRRIGAHSVRHIAGTDLLLTCTHKMAPGTSQPVRHFAVHAVTANETLQRMFEVQLGADLSMASVSEQLVGGFVFFEGNALDELKHERNQAAAGKSSAVATQRFNCVVVANVMYDQAVKASVCGAHAKEAPHPVAVSRRDSDDQNHNNNNNNNNNNNHSSGKSKGSTSPAESAAQQQQQQQQNIITPEYVLMNVVRLFVFRPRGSYHGTDYYIDLYFEKRNIAVFQLSALGQIVVLSPGYKAYFIDVKYFHPDVGPTVSYRLYLDQASQPRHGAAAAGSFYPPPPPPRVKPIPTVGPLDETTRFVDPSVSAASGGGMREVTSETSLDDGLVGGLTAAAAASASSPPAGPGVPPPPFDEMPFLGDHLPDCFLRFNCVPSRLPPIEVPFGDLGRFVIFFSTHTPAVLSLDSRTPVWIAAQQSLLRDRLRKPMHPYDRCHDGEHNARGLLQTMDRIVMSVAGRASVAVAPGSSLSHSGAGSGSGSLPRFPQDRARAALEDDTASAIRALVPVFRSFATRMRDPVGLCLEWIIAAAYFRLGWRLSAPPRLAFNLSAYEGLIHPHSLPRTTQHIRGTTVLMNTFMVDCAACAASSTMSLSGSVGSGGGLSAHNIPLSAALSSLLPGWSVRVHPRDELVKAIENRIDETIPGRATLIQAFREFGAYEEEILEFICPALLHDVRFQLYPVMVGNKMGASALSGGAGGGGKSNKDDLHHHQQQQSRQSSLLSGGANSTSQALDDRQQQQQQQSAQQQSGGPLARRVPIVPESLRKVNELSFLLCRLTALEILGVRLDRERASPIFSTTIVFFAAENRILPFNALARALWLRAITNQTEATSTALLSPMSHFANLENRRLNVLVTQGVHVAARRRRFMPLVNPTSVALAPFGGGAGSASIGFGGSRAMSWAPTDAEQGWDDDFGCYSKSRTATKFLRRLKKKHANET